jgi:hypothetical protein
VLVTLSHLNDRREYAQGEVARLTQARGDAEAARARLDRHAEPPPYSILKVDEWRDDADVLREHIAAIEAAIKHLDGELERAQAETRRADEALRRANDARDAASGEARRDQEQWRRDLAELQVRTAGAALPHPARPRSESRGSRDPPGGAPAARQADRDRHAQHALRRERSRAGAPAPGRRQRRDREGSRPPRAAARGAAEAARRRGEGRRTSRPGTPEKAAAEARLKVASGWLETVRNESEIAQGLPASSKA